MTNLPKIKSGALPVAIETVNCIFEEACRYIDGPSQPLPMDPVTTSNAIDQRELANQPLVQAKADGVRWWARTGCSTS
jgi:hypothetical protein